MCAYMYLHVHFHYSMFSETAHGLPTTQFVYLVKSVSLRSLVFTCVHVPVHVTVVAGMCLYIHVQGVKKIGACTYASCSVVDDNIIPKCWMDLGGALLLLVG